MGLFGGRDDDPGHDDNDDDEVLVELAKTQLRVCADELQRVNAYGGLLLRIPLADVESIELRASFDPLCLAFFGMGAGLAAVAFFIPEYVIATILLYVGAVGLAGLACFGMIARYFVIRTRDGETTVYCADSPDEGECFVISVRQLLRKQKEPKPARDREPETGFQK
jgi:hypothetical protein